MGSSYTNLQVRTRDYDRVVSILRDGNALPVYVSKPCDRGWISVYPRGTENQDPQLLRALAQRLSKDLETGVFGFLVHDSDLFWYVLFENGKQSDEYESDPGYFDGEDVGPSGGNMRAVVRYCIPGTTIKDLTDTFSKKPNRVAGTVKFLWHLMRKDLEKAFSSTSVFRGDSLAANFGARLGLPRDRVCLGFKYIKQGSGDQVSLTLLKVENENRSREVKSGPPILITESQRRSRDTGGSPKEERFGNLEVADFALEVGEELNWYGTIRNIGGSSKGVRITIEGDALGRGMFEFVQASVEKWLSQTDEDSDYEPPDADDESYWPFIVELSPTQDANVWKADIADFDFENELLMRLPIAPNKVGEAKLKVTLTPFDDSAKSSAKFAINMRVKPEDAHPTKTSRLTASLQKDLKNAKPAGFGALKISFPADYAVAADNGKGFMALLGVKYHLRAFKGQDTQFKLSIQAPSEDAKLSSVQVALKQVRREKRARLFTANDSEQIIGANAQLELAQWESAKLSGFVAIGKAGGDLIIVNAETSDQAALREMRDVVFTLVG